MIVNLEGCDRPCALARGLEVSVDREEAEVELVGGPAGYLVVSVPWLVDAGLQLRAWVYPSIEWFLFFDFTGVDFSRIDLLDGASEVLFTLDSRRSLPRGHERIEILTHEGGVVLTYEEGAIFLDPAGRVSRRYDGFPLGYRLVEIGAENVRFTSEYRGEWTVPLGRRDS